MLYMCCDERRRAAVQSHPTLNGIDFLEVLDDPALADDQRQRTLFVHFLKSVAGATLTTANLRIEGGERIRDIAVVGATTDANDEQLLAVQVSQPGDFSIYTLRLVPNPGTSAPPWNFDPLLSVVDFSFKVNCPSDFDCASEPICPPEPNAGPDIDYLARDYASLRRLMLDRMAALLPQWRERNPADSGIALVELLAYVGDHLSYQQDAVMTEGYLGTARRRPSVRRHARLVDYAMHDGCNARAWVQVAVSADNIVVSKGTQVLSRIPGLEQRIAPDWPDSTQAQNVQVEVFETMHEARLFQMHNQLLFYTWGDSDCCLPKGATRATLRDEPARRLLLRPGDVLVFVERLGPATGVAADADRTRRQAVRLTRADPAASQVLDDHGAEIGRIPGPLRHDPLTEQAIVEIEWDVADALSFPLCISASTSAGDRDDVSIALGNIVLVDHGLTIAKELIGTVPAPNPVLARASAPGGDRCKELVPPVSMPLRFRPRLGATPLTFAAPFDLAAPASAAMRSAANAALPAIFLQTNLEAESPTWHPQRDLLGSEAFAQEFVVEVEADGSARIRFGDGRYGARPTAGTSFWATYRVGNGTRGNLGAGAIAHIVSADPAILEVTNPLPAQGGSEMESIDEVRQRAPGAFRTQQRAVTAADYAEVAQRHPEVQRAAATFRWTGSWRTVFLTVDRLGGQPVDAVFESKLRQHMERFRMAGYDLEIDGPRFVALEIALRVCVQPGYFRDRVKAALLDVFSAGRRQDGRPGVFHPDHFSFGQPVYLSRIYAAAQAVVGVASVQVITFQRQGVPSPLALASGKIELDRLEIARLDNSRNFPERGVFRLTMEGGK